MASIVGGHAPFLKEAGFKKRRYGFNRSASDGLVHVVHFWMAPKEPPAWTEVPGLRERRYGGFRLDFGVYVPEMTRSHKPRSNWVNDYDCHLRRTIGQLLPVPASDFWWRLDDPRAADFALQALQQYGLAWLDGYPDRDSILNAFERSGPLPLGMTPAGALDIADLYRATKRPDEERASLERYVAKPVRGGHADYLSKYLSEHGHQDLIGLITLRD